MSYEYLDLLCMGCFARLEAGGVICPYCGFDEKSYDVAPYQLPLRTILGGKYMIGKVLGEGGFGITYIGYDLNLDVKVAVKEFYPSDLVTRANTVSTTVQPYSGERSEYFAKGRNRFVDEARRLAKFRVLPGIVLVNDFLSDNGTAYIIMEYVEGQTLKDYVAQAGGKLPPGQVIELMSPVFGSLAQIHESGIVHRDISPDNVMITADGSIKLLDFGAAREFGEEDDDKSLSVMLKHGYAPAEQYSTKGMQGAHTDVYALSATIYKAITGVTPESSMDRIMDDTVVQPSRLGVSIQDYQEAALMKGMAVRHQDRYRTASELYEGLLGHVMVTAPQGTQTGAPRSGDPAIKAPGTHPPASTAPPVTPHAKKSKNKVIGAVIAACVVVAIILAITLPGAEDSENMPPGNAPDADIAEVPPEPVVTPQPDDDPEPVFEEEPVYQVLVAGRNPDGQADVYEWQDIVGISAGDTHSAGVKEDGTVVAAGRNDFGQCNVSGWRDITDVVVGGAERIEMSDGSSVGGGFTVGLKANGTVVATGWNITGQCNVSDWHDIIAIDTGSVHTVGLKSDGTLVAAGENHHGECDVSGWSDIIAVSAGGFHTAGLKSDGTVVATGGNKYGQTNVSGWRDIVAISAGEHHIAGLKSDGTVVAAGAEEIDQSNISGWRDIVKISTGWVLTVGIKSDGTVVSAGENDVGNHFMSDWNDVAKISAGKYHIIGLTTGSDNIIPGIIPTIGIGNDDVNTPVTGVIVTSVSPGSAGDRAGLKLGDIIVSLGGETIKNVDELQNKRNTFRIGETTTIGVWRSGEEMLLDITFTN